ncbi:MAG TPA: tRNA (adenosine(37)-N6)-threonylcarbamoyltransferase complex dimerization subunit type 1 TsaB [Gemmatimonadales bacterium]
MTLTLAVDTATDVASVALGDDATVLGQRRIAGRRHSALLLPSIDALLRSCSRGVQDLRTIVIADGPGSFTGLRIGFATVQGLVRGHQAAAPLRVATVPSLLAAAWGAAGGATGPVLAMYDALRGDVFAAVYRFGTHDINTLLAPGRMALTTLTARDDLDPAVVVADGVHPAAAPNWKTRFASPASVDRNAVSLLALMVAGAGTIVQDVATYEPTYGRLAEAQVRWEDVHGRRLPDSPGHRR